LSKYRLEDEPFKEAVPIINIFDSHMKTVAMNNQPVHPIFAMTCFKDSETIEAGENYMIVINIDWNTTKRSTLENKKFTVKVSAPCGFKISH